MAVKPSKPTKPGKSQLKPDGSNKKLTPAKKRIWLDAYGQSANITYACEVAGITRTCYIKWMQRDPEFARQKQLAEAKSVEILEAEARRRALEGVERRLFYKGKEIKVKGPDGKLVPYVERSYSDVLTIFLLKAANPAKYCDTARAKSDVDPASNGGADFNGLVKQVSEELQKQPDYIEFLRWKATQEDKATTEEANLDVTI